MGLTASLGKLSSLYKIVTSTRILPSPPVKGVVLHGQKNVCTLFLSRLARLSWTALLLEFYVIPRILEQA